MPGACEVRMSSARSSIDAVRARAMAGMTDTAFRGWSSGREDADSSSRDGELRRARPGIDRTLEYAEYTEEERPVPSDLGGDPSKMAEAAQIVERMGADIVDVNRAVPLTRLRGTVRMQPHARTRPCGGRRACDDACGQDPLTVKMRAGWDETAINAPDLAKRLEARRVGGCCSRAYRGTVVLGVSDWDLIERVAAGLSIPCSAAVTASSRAGVDRMRGPE